MLRVVKTCSVLLNWWFLIASTSQFLDTEEAPVNEATVACLQRKHRFLGTAAESLRSNSSAMWVDGLQAC